MASLHWIQPRGAQGKVVRACPRKDANDAKPSPKAERNSTSLDSRIIKNPDKAFIQAYNAEAAVGVDSQSIVAVRLSHQAADGLIW